MCDRRNLDSEGRENFGGLCACFETKITCSRVGMVGFADSCVLCTRYFLFCAAARMSLTSAIELAEASLETD
jgi:hypothetical protein